MSDLVLDTSAAVRLLLAEGELSEEALTALAQADQIHVPQLLFAELANALGKYVRAQLKTETEVIALMRQAKTLVSVGGNDADLVEEALAAAIRFEHPAYDLLYAILARRRACAVLTVDRKLKAVLAEMRIDSLS